MLKQLLERGDGVSLANGRLEIAPASKKSVCNQWMNKHRGLLIREIVEATGLHLYEFTDYTTGYMKGYSQDRLTLNFVGACSGLHVIQHYNVSLRRQRTTAKYKQGDLLPKGRFIPRPRSAFVTFWNQIGLDKPRKSSEYHWKLSQLKSIYFVGESEIKGNVYRFKDKEIHLADISHQRIATGVFGRQLTGVELPRNCQETAKELLTSCQGTAKGNCQGNGAISGAAKPTEQINYAAEKVRLKTLRVTHKAQSTSVPHQTNDQWLEAYENN